ncbi:uncharacterized protein LOC134346435 [Mobula hypostoma]|uniref:uncharacterized protein LOC134346435 n=1 Tax=Mobula hypostoma TaxID=723540 RepID=UPI002FC36DF6
MDSWLCSSQKQVGSVWGVMMAAGMTDVAGSCDDLTWMKRPQLQKLCKSLGLRAVGKNAELIARLSCYITQTSPDEAVSKPLPQLQGDTRIPLQWDTPDEQDPLRVKEDSGVASGWCVVHGMELLSSGWSSLALKCGRPVVVDGDSLFDLHLKPAVVETPPHLEDNKICQECLQRNAEEDSVRRQRPPKRWSGIPLLIRRQMVAPCNDISTPASRDSMKMHFASVSRKFDPRLGQMWLHQIWCISASWGTQQKAI